MQVVAHFGASWCVTSLSMNYKFEELAQTHPEILFLYVDVDDIQVTILSFFIFFVLIKRKPFSYFWSQDVLFMSFGIPPVVAFSLSRSGF